MSTSTVPPSRPEPDPRLRLLDLTVEEARSALVEILASMGEKPFRARQILRQVLGRGVRTFEAMTDLPGSLRAALDERVRIGLLDLSHRSTSSDGTVKSLWRLWDGREIESVSIPTTDRDSFCISSQVGCALSCRFCATAALGLARNLTAGEMVDQVLAMRSQLPEGFGSTSVIFMGMGEPGYNLDAVLQACRTLNDPEGVGIGARHLTISTAGVVPAILRLADEGLQLRLAVSLHAGEQALRESLMNVASRHPLSELLAACQAYHDATGRRVTFEYAVMPGINDQPRDAASLAAFAGQVDSKINLIPYNPVSGFEAGSSTERDAARFQDELARHYGGTIVIRRTRGRDIDAACGMLHRSRSERPATTDAVGS